MTYKEYVMEDALEALIDYRGKTPKKSSSGIPTLSAKSVKNNLINYSECYYISPDEYKRFMVRGFPKKGDILLTTEAPLGMVARLDRDDVAIAQRLLTLRGKQDVLDNDYLLYLLQSPYGQGLLKAKETGTTVTGIKQAEFRKIIVKLPDIEIQRKIGSILRSIDDKISTNQKVNDNLQQQLRAIFKAEFTENPELEKMTQIPLSDLCHVVTKGTTPTTLGKSFVGSGINFIKAESILDDHSIDKSKFAFIDEETNALLKRSIIHTGDVVFTIAGTLGRFSLIDDNILPANTNQAVAIIRADAEKVLPEYIYTCFIGDWHTDYYAKRVQQAVQANLSLTTIKSLPIPLLDDVKMDEYLHLILPLIKAIKGNEAQNEKLVAIRDGLLPKLLSGEIDVSDIQV